MYQDLDIITGDTSLRATHLGIPFGEKEVRGRKRALFDHEVRSNVIFNLHILCSDHGKSARQKRQ